MKKLSLTILIIASRELAACILLASCYKFDIWSLLPPEQVWVHCTMKHLTKKSWGFMAVKCLQSIYTPDYITWLFLGAWWERKHAKSGRAEVHSY